MADGSIPTDVMIWALVAFAMPCLALTLLWRAGRRGARPKSRPRRRLSAKYGRRLEKLPNRSAQVTPMAQHKGKRAKQ